MAYPTTTPMGTSMPRRRIPSSDSKIMRLRLESGGRFLALGVSSFVTVASTAELPPALSFVAVVSPAGLSLGVSGVAVASTARLSVGLSGMAVALAAGLFVGDSFVAVASTPGLSSGAAVGFAAALSVGLSGDVTDIKKSPGSGHDESHPYR